MSDKKIQGTGPLICGLWGATVVGSEYNLNGKCDCIGCFGTHCQRCRVYAEKAQSGVCKDSICDKCLSYENQKTR